MRSLIALSLLFISMNSNAQTIYHHQLHIVLRPQQHRLEVEDRVKLPSGSPRMSYFFLHRDLHPVSPDASIEEISGVSDGILQRYRVTLPASRDSFILKYSGEIFHPPQQDVREARTFENSPGIIAPEGVVLSGASGWYPMMDVDQVQNMVSFNLDIAMPQDWHAVSQGKYVKRNRLKDDAISQEGWEESQPQDEVFLVAAPFKTYQRNDHATEALVYLRNDDMALAQRYLDATDRYIELYRRMIGDYPYAKFALVENFWETGYGMPSFTLLGSQVIRLPFIVDTSYPHEILHNWWGNGVYVDYPSGNWSEGLTAYLADHLLQEQKGSGAEYRRGMLQKYADFVSAGRDFPLAEFTSRHSAQSEAVGYGKALMVFHMLRRRMGDDKFLKALQEFYHEFKFKRAGFADLEKIFSQASGEDLGKFFEQWIQHAGAPQLSIDFAEAHRTENGYELVVSIGQTQAGLAYLLEVPLIVTIAGQDEVYPTMIRMEEKHAVLRVKLDSQPLRVDVDPEFDLFRRLDRTEIPPAFSQVFGNENLMIIVPRNAGEEVREQYLAAARRWQQQPGRTTRVVWDDEIEQIPSAGTVWLFGWENRWRGIFQDALAFNGAKLSDQGASLENTTFPRDQHAFALTAHIGQTPAAWLAVTDAQMMTALTRKLPHYSKYSYAVFKGMEVANIAKGIWEVSDSSLAKQVHQADRSIPEATRGKLEPRTSLQH